jgi:formate transporter
MNRPPAPLSLDMRLPPEVAAACEAAGVAKAGRGAIDLLTLGVLAGAFIAFGGIFMTVILTGSSELPWGFARALAGVAFSVGLVLVVVAGAELFTGDALMVVAFAARRITFSSLLRAWSFVYAGNIIGALGTVALMLLAGQHGLAGGGFGRTAVEIANAKVALPTSEIFFRALLCNVLVCLAVWMSFGARSATDKIMVVVPPVATFVAAGFEHSIANLYLLPYGYAVDLMTMEPGSARTDAAIEASGIVRNLVVSTLGNLMGGSVMVGAVYWFVYLRASASPLAGGDPPE